jgi:hypothetical protein
MDIRSLLEKLTSDEARAALRTAAHFVLDFVGDERTSTVEENGSSMPASRGSDAVKIASAVAATAGVAERAVKAARKSKGGRLGLGIAIGAAVGAGVLYLASPKGRAKARELWHRARGWRKPRSNGAPVEMPPPH